MLNNNGITVKVNCEYEETESVLIIYGLTKEEIKDVFNNYNNEYDSGKYDGDCGNYLNDKRIEFKEFVPDMQIEI